MREKHERETSVHCLSFEPLPGTRPQTQAHALTPNRTSDLSLRRMTSSQLSHVSQGQDMNFLKRLGQIVCRMLHIPDLSDRLPVASLCLCLSFLFFLRTGS